VADETNPVVTLEINQSGNVVQSLHQTAEASREAAQMAQEATSELARSEAAYQSQLKARGGVLATLTAQRETTGPRPPAVVREEAARPLRIEIEKPRIPTPDRLELSKLKQEVERPKLPELEQPKLPKVVQEVEAARIPEPQREKSLAEKRADFAAGVGTTVPPVFVPRESRTKSEAISPIPPTRLATETAGKSGPIPVSIVESVALVLRSGLAAPESRTKSEAFQRQEATQTARPSGPIDVRIVGSIVLSVRSATTAERLQEEQRKPQVMQREEERQERHERRTPREPGETVAEAHRRERGTERGMERQTKPGGLSKVSGTGRAIGRFGGDKGIGKAAQGLGVLGRLLPENLAPMAEKAAAALAKPAMVLGAVAVGSEIASMGMRSYAEVLNTLGDSSLSSAQKTRMLVEGIPIIGSLVSGIRQLSEALSGLAERMRIATWQTQQNLAANAADASGKANYWNQRLTDFGSLARETELKKAVLPAMGPTKRDTYMDELAYKRAQEMQPIKDRLPVAQAEERAAKTTHEASIELLNAAKADSAKYRTGRNVAQAEHDKLKSGGGGLDENRKGRSWHIPFTNTNFQWNSFSQESERQFALQKQMMLMKEESEKLAKNEGVVAAAANSEAERGAALERAKSATRQINIEMGKSELQQLQQKEGLLSSQASRVGAMHLGQKMRMTGIAKQIEERGYDSLIPQQRDALRGVAPEYVRAQDERRGSNDPMTLAFQKAGIFEKGRLAETREKVDAKQMEVKLDIKIDQDKLAEGIRKSTERLIDVLLAAWKKGMDDAIKKVLEGLQTAAANR
jgi:hypothetical protein